MLSYAVFIHTDNNPRTDRIFAGQYQSLAAATDSVDSTINEYSEAVRKHPDLSDLIGFRMSVDALCFWGINEVIRVYEREVK